MSIKGFGFFIRLIKNGHDLTAMGLHGTQGDVLRLSNRLRVVKRFRGIKLEGVTPRTTKGYDALILVFLTHSALEQYLQLTGQKLGDIEPAHRKRQAAQLIAEIFDSDDRKGKLFDFLLPRLNKHLQGKLTDCRDKKCCNMGVVSGAIRHIFAHGHLTANPNRMRSEGVYRICRKVSDFLVAFMDDDFHRRMVDEYERGKKLRAVVPHRPRVAAPRPRKRIAKVNQHRTAEPLSLSQASAPVR
jgi:hypothetical protein